MDHPPAAPNYLRVHEWLAVMVLISIISLLIAVTLAERYADKPSTELLSALSARKEGFELIVRGAVDYPGLYTIPHQINLREFLTIVQIQPEADLRRFNLDSPVRKGRLNIPTVHMLTIYLKGAVKHEGPLKVIKGTLLKDLLEMDILKENADPKSLQKKRKLKEGEAIEIQVLVNPI